MSTKFGILNIDLLKECDQDSLEEINKWMTCEDRDEELFIEVAHRSNGLYWTNPLALYLDDSIPVFALDNSPQGIFTIGDIREAMIK